MSRSISAEAKTSIAQWDCICCDRADSRQGEFPSQTNQKIQPSAAGTYESPQNSSGRCRDRSPSDECHDGVIERSPTRCVSNRPRSRCIPSCQTPTSADRFPKSAPQKEPICFAEAGHGQELEALRRQKSFVFFPPREYSPSFTLVLVSTEISSVCGSASDSAFTALTFSKIASVCLVFLSGLPF